MKSIRFFIGYFGRFLVLSNMQYTVYNRHDQYWQISYPKFGRLKLQKNDLNIYIFYFRKLSRFWGQYSSTALVIDTFYAI